MISYFKKLISKSNNKNIFRDESYNEKNDNLETYNLNNSDQTVDQDNTSFENYLQDVSRGLKERARNNVNLQLGNLKIDYLERVAWKRILKLNIRDSRINIIKNKLSGVVALLESGELTYLLLDEVAHEKEMLSANLQLFCNATEIMMYISFIFYSDDETLRQFINSEIFNKKSRVTLYQVIENLNKETLISVLNEYRQNRNIIAHTCQMMSKEAAESFIQRTYENIQRMELLISQTFSISSSEFV